MLKERFQNQLNKEFTNEDWLDCLDLGSLKTRFEIFKDKDGEFGYVRCDPGTCRWSHCFAKTDELRDDSLQMERIHLSREHETNTLLQNLD